MPVQYQLEYTAETLASRVDLYNQFSTPQCQREAEELDNLLYTERDLVEPLGRLIRAVGQRDWDEENPFTLKLREAWLKACVVLNEDESTISILASRIKRASYGDGGNLSILDPRLKWGLASSYEDL